VFRDFRSLAGRVDAVINALPNALHAGANVFLLDNRVHVLCEKPLATTSADVRLCYDAAKRGGVILAPALHWRFYQSTRLLHLLLAEAALESPLEYDWQYGMPFDWPTASAFNFSREKAGGGVLFDQGIHLLDCLLSWFGPVSAFECATDDWGSGVEANALLTLRHDGGYGTVRGRVRLSNTFTLKNRLVISGRASTAEILRDAPHTVVLSRVMAGQNVRMSLGPDGSDEDQDPFLTQLQRFIEAAESTRTVEVTAADVVATIELIERCYEGAARLAEPWSDVAATRELAS